MAPAMTPLDRAVAIIDAMPDSPGGTELLAKVCGISRQFLNRMRREYRDTGRAPRALRDHAPAIEAAVDGQVPVEALYPAVNWMRDEQGGLIGYCVSLTGIRCSAPAANDDAAPADGAGSVEGAP